MQASDIETGSTASSSCPLSPDLRPATMPPPPPQNSKCIIPAVGRSCGVHSSDWRQAIASQWTPIAADCLSKTLTDEAGRDSSHSSNRPIWILDCGAGQGKSSGGVMTALLKAIREQDPKRPVCVLHQDQAGNDWSEMFKTVHGGYLQRDINALAFASGTLMNGRLLPDESLHLAMAFDNIHWLDRYPLPLSDGLVHSCSKDPAAVTAWAEPEAGGGGLFSGIYNVMNIMATNGWVSPETARKACFPFMYLPLKAVLEPFRPFRCSNPPMEEPLDTNGPLAFPAFQKVLPLQLEAIWTEDDRFFLHRYERRIASARCDKHEAAELFFDEIVSSIREWSEGMVTSFMREDCRMVTDSGPSNVPMMVEEFYATLRHELVRVNDGRPRPLGIKTHLLVIRKL
ncbi:unnamed protein product [Vitrella brassicaformis CCMP3155]|uniref:Uncharacterized protein n=1 Tax=Vitrella brassicaformis (strain CCMP3155) TaxID=1169540 RepID=A0A0G4GVT5_VITBC|nr:unnamed protein product [Vitrella brassicaformis CCMP3155]|eukprot:CEM35041.1 unnamed protein product [Vitrella brassicaformis CCMP3155]